MKSIIGVYGMSGFGREVMPLVREQLGGGKGEAATLVFIDDVKQAESANGHAILSYDEFLAFPAEQRVAAIAIADGGIRKKLSEKLRGDGLRPLAVRAANVVIMDAVEIGEGAILCPFVTLTSNIVIGRFFHANIYSYVAHDCRIGDYVTFAPAVRCNGNIVIEDHAYIGTGAILRQGKPGKSLVIGRGAVVTKDVPPGVTVVGNPVRPLIKSSL